MGLEEFRFDAFISYSRRADYRRVRIAEQFLETFHKKLDSGDSPTKPIQVCVDGSDFATARWKRHDTQAAALGAEGVIERYLSESRLLVVWCNRFAAVSPWVEHEVNWWLTHRGKEEIFLVLSDSSVADPIPDEMFPEPLRRAGVDREIWYDLRALGMPRRAKNLAHFADPEEELVRLASDILGIEAGTVIPSWRRQERRRSAQRLRISALVSLAMFALAGISVRSCGSELMAREKERSLRLSYEAEALIDRDVAASGKYIREAMSTEPSSRAYVVGQKWVGRQLRYMLPSEAPGVLGIASADVEGSLVSVDATGDLTRWNSATWTSEEPHHLTDQVVDLAVSSDASQVACVVADGSLFLVKTGGSGDVTRVPIRAESTVVVRSLANKNGFLVACWSGALYRIDPGVEDQAPKRIRAGVERFGILDLAVAPDGKRAAVADAIGNVFVIDLENRFPTTRTNLGADVTGLAWKGDAELFVGLTDGRIYSLGGGHGGPFPIATSGGSAPRLAANKNCLAVGSADGNLQVIDLEGRRLSSVETGSKVDALCWLSDGTSLAVASKHDHHVRIYDFSAALRQAGYRGKQFVIAMSASASNSTGRYAISGASSVPGGLQQACTFYDVRSPRPVAVLPFPEAGVLPRVWISHDGTRVALAEGSGVRIWAPLLGDVTANYDAKAGPPRKIAWTEGDTALIVSYRDQSIRVISTVHFPSMTWSSEGLLSHCDVVAELPTRDHRWAAASGSMGAFFVVPARQELPSMRLAIPSGSPYGSLAPRPDGKVVILGSYQGAVVAVNLERSSMMVVKENRGHAVTSVDWTSDGSRFAVAWSNGVANIFDATRMDVVAEYQTDCDLLTFAIWTAYGDTLICGGRGTTHGLETHAYLDPARLSTMLATYIAFDSTQNEFVHAFSPWKRIGLSVGSDPLGVRVKAVTLGGLAQRNGVAKGMILLRVDHVSLRGLTLKQATDVAFARTKGKTEWRFKSSDGKSDVSFTLTASSPKDRQ